MPLQSVLCIASSLIQAETIVRCLQDQGLSKNDISALFPDKTATRDFAYNHPDTEDLQGATPGAGTRAMLDGTLGWLAGIGALAIPGVGPLVAAGPIARALSGAAVGGTLGGITGGLIGMGIPESEARRYEGKVREGGILISVHTEDADEVKAVKGIFQRTVARDISTAVEAGVRAKETVAASC